MARQTLMGASQNAGWYGPFGPVGVALKDSQELQIRSLFGELRSGDCLPVERKPLRRCLSLTKQFYFIY